MKKTMHCSVLFAILFAPSVLHAGVGTVLFEETYTRDTGTPQTVRNCGTTCAASFTNGIVVTLTATSDAGSVFTSWSGCDTVSGHVCTVTTNGARLVAARFTASLYVDFGISGGLWVYNGSNLE